MFFHTFFDGNAPSSVKNLNNVVKVILLEKFDGFSNEASYSRQVNRNQVCKVAQRKQVFAYQFLLI